MPTYIARFRRALPASFDEWMFGIMFLAMGFTWLIFPASFYRPDSQIFLEIASARVWTTTMIMVGLITCISVATYTESPRVAGVIRVAANLCRLTIFGAFLGRSITLSDFVSISFGVFLYGTFFILDFRNIMNSASGTFNSFRKVYRVRPIALVR